jgi:hypothetical protein
MVNASMPREKNDAILCRPIAPGDLDGVAALLTRGFPDRTRSYWDTALLRLREREAPAGFPRYGYLLVATGRPVGVLLLIFAATPGAGAVRCNVSSWYVEPDFRSYASLLVSSALRAKGVTYLNISAASHTQPILQAQGYRRYSDGQAFVVPALAKPCANVVVRAVEPGDGEPIEGLDAQTANLLRRHAGYGCISLICAGPEGSFPFVFVRRPTARHLINAVQLSYCRDPTDFIRLAGNLGRFLLKRAIPIVVIDANGRPPGLVGKYVAGKTPKYFKGPTRPVLGDLSDTELTLFGP